jgi:hypothetical protein
MASKCPGSLVDGSCHPRLRHVPRLAHLIEPHGEEVASE